MACSVDNRVNKREIMGLPHAQVSALCGKLLCGKSGQDFFLCTKAEFCTFRTCGYQVAYPQTGSGQAFTFW